MKLIRVPLLFLCALPAFDCRSPRRRSRVRRIRPCARPRRRSSTAISPTPSGRARRRSPGSRSAIRTKGSRRRSRRRIKVVYDDDAIYFGAVMEDSGAATPLLARRDSDLNNGDYIRISIDSQQDRLNGAAFVVNASNVQMDMILYNDIYDDISWDAVWELGGEDPD